MINVKGFTKEALVDLYGRDSAAPYFDMYISDGSGVSYEYWTDTRSVGFHRHTFYELLIIDRGSCRHIYNGTETLLISGDAVVVPAYNRHGFSLNGETSVYNCQFLPEKLDPDLIRGLGAAGLWDETAARAGAAYAESESVHGPGEAAEDRESHYYRQGLMFEGYEANSSKQGVVHLSPEEYVFIRSVMEEIMKEFEKKDDLLLLKKRKYMEVLLLELYNAMRRQNQKYTVLSKENQMAISKVLSEMEIHLADPFDCDEAAKRCGFTPNHFRKIFKDVTGLPPVRYLNRLRMIRACEYIQREHWSLQEAAEAVGIQDMNYFSRLFRQVMNCSPRELMEG